MLAPPNNDDVPIPPEPTYPPTVGDVIGAIRYCQDVDTSIVQVQHHPDIGCNLIVFVECFDVFHRVEQWEVVLWWDGGVITVNKGNNFKGYNVTHSPALVHELQELGVVSVIKAPTI
ncbi:hypothetical protein EDB85DRAFT_1900489 [Lactarius pseudohatsudake]|nr:hypothetical protein EDB85DRAFT_1900489 [Lactarius pseudohatsudake]